MKVIDLFAGCGGLSLGFIKDGYTYDAIGNLPNPTSDGVIANPKPETDYQRYLASDQKTITNHTETKHSKLAIQRMHRVGNGENFTVLHEDIHSVHSGSYGRLCWNEQAPTITTRFDTPSGGQIYTSCL